MHDGSFLYYAVCYLAAAVIAVPLFRKLGFGAILGYLAAGVVIGPNGLVLISDPEDALRFSELGVVMLLFVIGLELAPDKLWQMRWQISLLGGGQLLLSAMLIALVLIVGVGVAWQMAVLIGLTLGLSSTAFAVQLMDEQEIMGSALGRKGFSILLLQDMAVIPLLLLVGLWAPREDEAITTAGWLGPLIVVAVLLAGRVLIRPVLRQIAQHGSREVLTAASLLIILGISLLMQKAHLSMGMGAFLAGIILANSRFRHQLQADVEPFKGLLLGLFFIAVGMTLDLSMLLERPLMIVGLALLLMLIKSVVVASLVRFSGSSNRESLLLGLLLSQGGEFAFVVMTKATSLALVERQTADLVVLVVGLSMALTAPAVMALRTYWRRHPIMQKSRAYDTVNNHESEVIIAGFDRFGQIVGRLLAANGIKFTALDKDARHVEFVRQFGHRIYFGDAARLDLLEAAGIRHARVLVVAVDSAAEALAVVSTVHEAYPNLTVIARAHDRASAYQLYNEGIEYVIRETFESSLLAASRTLMELGFTESQATEKAAIFRQHDEQLIKHAVAHGYDQAQLIKLAEEGRRELEDLFKQDSSI